MKRSCVLIKWLGGLGLSLLLTLPVFATASENTQDMAESAFRAYQQKQYDEALSFYQQAQGFDASMGVGSAAYRLQDLQTSIISYRKAVWLAQNDHERAQALFNLGNSYFRMEMFALAVEAYQQALVYKSAYSDAQHNLKLAETELAQQIQKAQKEAEARQGEEGDQGQGQGAGEREGKLSMDQNYIGGAGEENDEDEKKEGEKMVLPQDQQRTEFVLKSQQSLPELNSQASGRDKIRQQTINRQRAQKFALQLQELDLQQQALLQRMLEREEGFHARQEKSHPIPGVEPW